jgi:hypothetical protein
MPDLTEEPQEDHEAPEEMDAAAADDTTVELHDETDPQVSAEAERALDLAMFRVDACCGCAAVFRGLELELLTQLTRCEVAEEDGEHRALFIKRSTAERDLELGRRKAGIWLSKGPDVLTGAAKVEARTAESESRENADGED